MSGTWSSALALVVCLALSFGAGAAGSLFQPGEWYAALRKPTLTPPGWVFGVVWPALYALMGIAAWLVWRKGGWGENRLALGLFVVQLVLNAAWTGLFFGLHRPGWALLDLAAMWAMILATLIAFWLRAPVAGALLIPYLAWVSFAAYLNFTFWRLNN